MLTSHLLLCDPNWIELAHIPVYAAGSEFGVVVLSTVRTQPVKDIKNKDIVQADRQWIREKLGFVTDEHQICVGITRSKYGLVIVGELFTSLSSARLKENQVITCQWSCKWYFRDQ